MTESPSMKVTLSVTLTYQTGVAYCNQFAQSSCLLIFQEMVWRVDDGVQYFSTQYMGAVSGSPSMICNQFDSSSQGNRTSRATEDPPEHDVSSPKLLEYARLERNQKCSRTKTHGQVFQSQRNCVSREREVTPR